MEPSRISEDFNSFIEASIKPFVHEFESRWSKGPSNRPQIEEYLADRGEVEKSAALFYLLTAELQLLHKDGISPTQDDYSQRFPGHLSLIGSAFGEVDTADYKRASADTSLPTPAEIRAQGTPESADGIAPRVAPSSTVAGRKHPDRIGDYELLRIVGRGGMGIVYRARQCSLNRIVAVKRILSGAAADYEQIQRFRTEAEAAAKLDHPHIVPIYEIGEHDSQPFFSMGYVDGKSLAEYTSQAPLSEQRTAEIVLKITRAIAHAHGQGVIHRDLKPGNVLVDRQGEPRITDFGLAKQVEAGSGHTATGQILGTPSYMPPEQAEGRVADVSTSADIYAIGATLYFLLTGRPPFRAPSPVETLLQVCQQEPVPPRKLNALVARDLETICTKCLEKEPRSRYASAETLAEDIARFLRGEPILARPVTALERSVKWARRRPAIALLLSVILLSFVVAFSGFTWYHFRLQRANTDLQQALTTAREQEQRANQQRERADRSATLADEQRNLALATLHSIVWDIHELLRDTPATLLLKKELLTTAIDGLSKIPREGSGTELANRTSAVAHSRMGDVLRSLGRSEEARREYEQAIEILEPLRDTQGNQQKGDRDLAVAYERLGHICLRYEQDVPGAIEHFRAVQAIREQLVASSPNSSEANRDLTVTYEDLGDAHLLAGKWEDAEAFYRRSLVIRQRLAAQDKTGEAQRDLSVSYGKLGELKLRSMQLDAARQFLEKALDIDRRRAKANPSPQNKRDLAVTYTKLGRTNMRLDDATTALEFHKKSLAIRRELVGQDAGNVEAAGDVVVALDDVGNANLALGNVAEALASYREGLGLREQLARLDVNNRVFKRGLYISLENLARVNIAQKDLPAAYDKLQKSLALRKELAGSDRQNAQTQRDLAVAHNGLATVAAQMSEFKAARQHFQEALKICESLAASTGSQQARIEVIQNWIGIGQCDEELREFQRARQSHQAALDLVRELDEPDAKLKQFIADRIKFCERQGKSDEGDGERTPD